MSARRHRRDTDTKPTRRRLGIRVVRLSLRDGESRIKGNVGLGSLAQNGEIAV